MKKIGFVILVLSVFVLWHFPLLGLAFAASMVAASLVAVVKIYLLSLEAPWMVAYLSVAWKVYAGLAVFTFLFLTTFVFQNCCVGMQTFRAHLKHRGWKEAGEDFVGSVLWPLTWFNMDTFLRAWGMTFADAFLNAFEYWLVDSWKGTKVVVRDVYTGISTVTRVKMPEDAQRIIVDTIKKDLGT